MESTSTPAPRRSLRNIGIIVGLVVAFVGGVALVGYVGYQMLVARAMRPKLAAAAPQETATLTATLAPSPTSTATPTPTRVVVAETPVETSPTVAADVGEGEDDPAAPGAESGHLAEATSGGDGGSGAPLDGEEEPGSVSGSAGPEGQTVEPSPADVEPEPSATRDGAAETSTGSTVTTLPQTGLGELIPLGGLVLGGLALGLHCLRRRRQ